jgi:hypothetical protein
MTHHTMQNQNVAEAELKDGVQQAKEVAKQAVDQVQQKAQEVASQAQDQAKSAVAARKDQAAEQLGSVAQAIRTTSGELRNQEQATVAQYVDKVADQVDRISGYLGERDVDQLLEDAENMARRQPELFLGGAFLVGLLLGRFIKSSGERRLARREQELGRRYQHYGYPENYPSGSVGFDRPSRDYGTFQRNVDQDYSPDYRVGTTEFDQPSGYEPSSSSDIDDDFPPAEPRKW